MKIQLTSFLILISTMCFGQLTFNTISDLRNYDVTSGPISPTSNTLGYYSKDDGGNNTFNWNPSSLKLDDSGYVIKPNVLDPDTPGRWEAQSSNTLNILQFGAKQDGSTDVSYAINRAIVAATPVNNNTFISTVGHGVVYVPRGTYKLSHTINIQTNVTLEGVGSGFFPYQEVRFIVAGNTKAVDIRASWNARQAEAVTLRNLWFRNYGVSTDSSADGCWCNTRVVFDNVTFEDFGGNGMSVVTNDSGNANNSIFTNCSFYYNAKNGFFCSGNESNNMAFYSCDFQTNGMCGFLDNSFIGNNLYGCHNSSNGLRNASTYSKTWCKYNGKIYQSIKYPNQKGVQPTVTSGWPEYWVENDAVNPTVVADWSADSTYWVTGAYFVAGTACTTHLFGCYSEGGQGKNVLNEFSIAWGGNHGVGFAKKRNIWLHAGASRIMVNGAGFRLYDKDSTNTWSGMDEVGGLMTSSDKTATPAHTGLQIKYFESDRSTKMFTQNSIGNMGIYFPGAGFNAGTFGRTTLSKTGMAVFPYYSGFFMGLSNNGAQARNILATSTTPPAGTNFGIGDFCLYMGSDTTIIGYRYVGSGNWKTLKSAN